MSGIICPKCESTDTVVMLADQTYLACHNCGWEGPNPDLDLGVPPDLSLPGQHHTGDLPTIIHGKRLHKLLEGRARTAWAKLAGNTAVCPQTFIDGLLAGWLDLARCQRDGMSQTAQEIKRELN